MGRLTTRFVYFSILNLYSMHHYIFTARDISCLEKYCCEKTTSLKLNLPVIGHTRVTSRCCFTHHFCHSSYGHYNRRYSTGNSEIIMNKLTFITVLYKTRIIFPFFCIYIISCMSFCVNSIIYYVYSLTSRGWLK